MAFYNTTNLTGAELAQSWKDSKYQDRRVFDFFLRNPHGKFTCWEVYDRVFPDYGGPIRVPKTSAGRSLNTLYKEGKIDKLPEQKRSGPYNRLCYLWRLNSKYNLEDVL